MQHRQSTVNLLEATMGSPTFAKLMALTAESASRLESIGHIIPQRLRGHLKAGPIDEAEWCILVATSSCAAKIRQLLPSIQAHLQETGADTKRIRLKVQKDDVQD